MRPFFATFRQVFLDVLFPPVCMVCRASLPESGPEPLCSLCRSGFLVESALTCPICRGRVPMIGGELPAKSRLCHPRAEYYLYSACQYSLESVQELVQQLKFRRQTAAASILGRLLADGIAGLHCDELTEAVIVPIPLSPRRLRERGFNQAELIAQKVSASLGLPIDTGVLVRTKNTAPQTLMTDRGAREHNLAGAFSVSDPARIAGKTILLIDDVWTSGSTANEAVRTLLSAGASRVIVAVAARA